MRSWTNRGWRMLSRLSTCNCIIWQCLRTGRHTWTSPIHEHQTIAKRIMMLNQLIRGQPDFIGQTQLYIYIYMYIQYPFSLLQFSTQCQYKLSSRMSVLGPGAVRDLLVVSQTVMHRVPISWGNDTIATKKRQKRVSRMLQMIFTSYLFPGFSLFWPFGGLPILMDYNRVKSIQYISRDGSHCLTWIFSSCQSISSVPCFLQMPLERTLTEILKDSGTPAAQQFSKRRGLDLHGSLRLCGRCQWIGSQSGCGASSYQLFHH